MSPGGFETSIPASEWPQTHALDRVANGIGLYLSRTYSTIFVTHLDKEIQFKLCN
jgi:hypothetical protein